MNFPEDLHENQQDFNWVSYKFRRDFVKLAKVIIINKIKMQSTIQDIIDQKSVADLRR